MIPAPVLELHSGVLVVRDDVLPGGTKLRFLLRLFDMHDEIAYASPACGGAQLALAHAARIAGKRATIFVAQRREPHARTRQAKAAGARVFQVPHGYLSNVQAKARRYCADTGAHLLHFGGESEAAITAIGAAAASAAEQAGGRIDEVWCAAGSGVLSRGLQRGIPGAKHYAVRVGRELRDSGMATVLEYPIPFERMERRPAPFPSCPNYDRKAWRFCQERSSGRALFWNVLGDA